jgi:hypothetical protein
MNGYVKFIEAKTPYVRKTFFINIPDTYNMKIDDDITEYPIFEMRSKKYEPSEEMVRNINQTISSDFDIVSLSSISLCFIQNLEDENITVYDLQDEHIISDSGSVSKRTSSSSSKSSASSVAEIKRNQEEIDKLVEDAKKDGVVVEDEDKDIDIEATPVPSSPELRVGDGDIPLPTEVEGTGDEIHLVFEGYKPPPPKLEKIDVVPAPSFDTKEKDTVVDDDISVVVDPVHPVVVAETEICEIPRNIEDEQLHLSMPYYCCSVKTYISHIKDIEVLVEKCMKRIDDFRVERWNDAVEDTLKNMDTVRSHFSAKIKKMLDKYANVKSNLNKLCTLFIKTQHTQTEYLTRSRKMIEETNVNLIHIRNDIDNFVDTYNEIFVKILE